MAGLAGPVGPTEPPAPANLAFWLSQKTMLRRPTSLPIQFMEEMESCNLVLTLTLEEDLGREAVWGSLGMTN